MKPVFNYEHFAVTHIENRRLKNISILIKTDGEVVLKSPRTSHSELRRLLDSKRAWIERKRDALLLIKRARFGEELEFFGEIISLSELSTLQKKIEKSSSDIHTQKITDDFYKKEAQAYLPARVEHFSALMNLHPSALKFRKMKRRWGSCSSQGIITFNSYLLKASVEQIDYVVIHELAHLKQMNHSKKFYSVIESILPHYKEVEKGLSKVLIY